MRKFFRRRRHPLARTYYPHRRYYPHCTYYPHRRSGPGPWPLVVYYYIITPLFYIIILFIDQLYIIKARLSGADLGEPIFEILHFFENPIFSILGVDGGDGDDDGRISSNLQPPLPIAPRDKISRSGKPLTPILINLGDL